MSKILRLLKIPTTLDVIINTSGNYLSVGFTALYAFVLFRVMNPAEYGILSVLFAVAYVLANILDFGVAASIYSYLPPILQNRQETIKFIKANFIFQTVLSTLVLIILFAFIEIIDKYVLKLYVPRSYFFWTFLAIPLLIWQNFFLNILYASKKFLEANIVINISNFLKTAVLFALIYYHAATIENVIITLGVLGQLVFVVLLIKERRHLLREFLEARVERSKVKLSYTLTFFASSQLFNMASRLDLFMLSFYLPHAEVGFYAAAQKVILSVLTSVNSITQVLSPQFSKISKKSEVLSLLKKGLFYMMIPTSIFLLAAITPKFIYTFFFTSKFIKTDEITRLLSISYILFGLTAIPVLFFLYTIRKPIHLLWINIIFFVVVLLGNFYVIPKFGVFGPPMAYLAGFLAATIYIIIFFIREYRKLK